MIDLACRNPYFITSRVYNKNIDLDYMKMPTNLDEKIKNTRLLIASTQHPGYGGAATNSYKLFKYISRNYPMIKCAIFFYTHVNFREISEVQGVFKIDCNSTRNHQLTVNQIEKFLNGQPQLIFAKNYVTPLLCRELWRKSYIVYLVAGMPMDSSKLMYMANNPEMAFDKNLTTPAIDSSDLILFNSKLIMDIHSKELPTYTMKFYPKILDTSSNAIETVNLSLSKIDTQSIKEPVQEPVQSSQCTSRLRYRLHSRRKWELSSTDKSINVLGNNSALASPTSATTNVPATCSKDLEPREYDIILNCSILTRYEKNNEFLIPILSSKAFEKYSKIIIGEDFAKFKKIPNSKCLGLLTHEESMIYFKKSKLLLYPSLLDANPNTVREAIHRHCLVLITNRVGFYEKFPSEYVIEVFDPLIWESRIIQILENYTTKFYSFDFNLYNDNVFHDDFREFLEYVVNIL